METLLVISKDICLAFPREEDYDKCMKDPCAFRQFVTDMCCYRKSLPKRFLITSPPTHLVAVSSPTLSTQKMEAALRRSTTPIIGRIESDLYLLDVRTLQPRDLPVIHEAFERMLAQILAKTRI